MEPTDFSQRPERPPKDAFAPVERKLAAWAWSIGIVTLWVLFAYSRIAG